MKSTLPEEEAMCEDAPESTTQSDGGFNDTVLKALASELALHGNQVGDGAGA